MTINKCLINVGICPMESLIKNYFHAYFMLDELGLRQTQAQFITEIK